MTREDIIDQIRIIERTLSAADDGPDRPLDVRAVAAGIRLGALRERLAADLRDECRREGVTAEDIAEFERRMEGLPGYFGESARAWLDGLRASAGRRPGR